MTEHLMGNERYQVEALVTESARVPLHPREPINLSRLLHAAIGMTTESGEFIDAIKKYLFYGKQLDKTNLKEEIGDLLWYIAIACDALETTIGAEMYRNINKLRQRYPMQFNEHDAMNRDLDAERGILEGLEQDFTEFNKAHPNE